MNKSISKFIRWLKYKVNSLWLILIFICLSASLYVLFQQPEGLIGKSSKSIFIVGLVNFNLLLLIALGFVVIRNIVKIFFDRQNKILGSKLRQRLVLAFISLTIVPIAIMFFLASGMINRAASGWFSSQVEGIVANSVEISKFHINNEKAKVQEVTDKVYQNIKKKFTLSNKFAAERLAQELKNKYQLYSIKLYNQQADILLETKNLLDNLSDFSEPIIRKDQLKQIIKNGDDVFFEENSANQFIRAFREFQYNQDVYVLVVTKIIDQELTTRLKSIAASYREYGQLQFYREPLKTSYFFTLALITGVLLFAAIWFGLYLARNISIPLNRLADATNAVAQGNYDFNLNITGNDEVADVAKSFNKMMLDLKNSREEVEQRRIYTETILDNLAVGVIALNTEMKVSAINEEAKEIFVVEENLLGLGVYDFFNKIGLEQIKDYITDAIYNKILGKNEHRGVVEKEIDINIVGQKKKLIVTVGKVQKNQEFLGIVIIFDDISDLAQAQAMSVWREVAKRIAHEIKNPLTPIKLTAQRIAKNIDKQSSEDIKKSVETIVDNVDLIKVLIDEFSRFARLPVAEFENGDLNELILTTASAFQEDNKDIIFEFELQNNLPQIIMDYGQISRVIINLIENSVYSLKSSNVVDPRVKIKTSMIKSAYVRIEVIDNGKGIKEDEKLRIFEPYFTTKKDGTGLGLAIVNSIISDHFGGIKIIDNKPQGVNFIIELPIKHTNTSQRRLKL